MSKLAQDVGRLWEQTVYLERQMAILALTEGNPALEKTAMRAMLHLTRVQRALHRRSGRRNGAAKRLPRLQEEIAEAQRLLAAAMPVGGQAPLPPPSASQPPPLDQPAGLFVLTRDPRNLAGERNFQAKFESFSCKVPHGSPATPDKLPPTFSVEREFRVAVLTMPDGTRIDFWTFHKPGEALNAWPASLIRVPQGALFHGTMKPRVGTHTIHWHAIEPTPMNDGVGKLSFDVDSQYTYQWFAAEPGTYFYHCHHNTALHFHLGMVGALIVDPRPPAGDPLEAGFNVSTEPGGYPAGGPGYVLRANGPFVNALSQSLERYDVEAFWLISDVDPRWHRMSHDEGLGCPFGEDAGQNMFEPQYFLLSGSPQGPTGFARTITVRAGQTLLVRLLDGTYTVNTMVFRPATAADTGLSVPAAGLPGTIIASDARTLGHPPFMQYSSEIPLAPGEVFEMTAARRFDILFEPGDEHVGDHVYRTEFFHYVAPEGERGRKLVGAQGVDGAMGLIRVLPRA
jgi:hypothetical protein